MPIAPPYTLTAREQGEKMRLPFSKRDPFPIFDLKEEYKKLNQLFHDKDAFSIQSRYSQQRDYYSYYDVLDEFFLQWHLRKECTSVEEMMCKLHISENDLSKKVSEESFLDYVQFVINAVEYVKGIVVRLPFEINRDNYSIGNAIKDNCLLVLNKLNAEVKAIDLELCVVYKNDVATAVSMQQPGLSPSIVEYQKIENRDNLGRKAEILCSLYKTLESKKDKIPITKDFKPLYKATTMLFNCAGIRHFIPDEESRKSTAISLTFQKMNTQERLKWYDRTFKMFLACIAYFSCLEFKGEYDKISNSIETKPDKSK